MYVPKAPRDLRSVGRDGSLNFGSRLHWEDLFGPYECDCSLSFRWMHDARRGIEQLLTKRVGFTNRGSFLATGERETQAKCNNREYASSRKGRVLRYIQRDTESVPPGWARASQTGH